MSFVTRWRYRRLLARMAGPRLLRAFGEAYPEAFFVEIGANDGAQHDHLREHILERSWRGIMVEPVPYVFARLQGNYGSQPGVVLENAAIAPQDGTMPFFHLAEADPQERAGLPEWYDALGSFSRESILSHAPQIPDIERRLVETEVPTLAFDSLLAKHGADRVDLVLVDTEGYDFEVLKVIDLARHRPRLVVYEHFNFGEQEQLDCRAYMQGHGYELLEEGFDTFCHLPERDDALAAVFGGLRPAVASVSKRDEPAG